MAISTENFAQIALQMPDAVQSAHMGTTDFRIANKIFATLKPEDGRTVLKLSPDQQQLLFATHKGSASAINGIWGEKGWTLIHLVNIEEKVLTRWMQYAWFTTAAPKYQKLHPQFG